MSLSQAPLPKALLFCETYGSDLGMKVHRPEAPASGAPAFGTPPAQVSLAGPAGLYGVTSASASSLGVSASHSPLLFSLTQGHFFSLLF